MYKLRLNITVFLLSITILILGCSEKSDTTTIALASYKLLVPSEYVDSDGIVSQLFQAMRLGKKNDSIIVRIPSSEVVKSVSNYNVDPSKIFQDDLELLITVLNPMEVKSHSDPYQYRFLSDLWNSESSYKKRIVENDNVKGWLRVYRKSEYPDSFAIIKSDFKEVLPDTVKEFWIAHCLILGSEELPSIRCSTFTLVENVLIEFHVSKENLESLEQITAFIVEEFESWKVTVNKKI